MEQTLIDQIKAAVKEVIQEQLKDVWMDKKELANYWKVSVSWIDHNIDSIPHSSTPIRFQKSKVDIWRNGVEDSEKCVAQSKINVKSYTKNNFKIV